MHDQQHRSRLPGQRRPRRSACTARVEVSPPPWNCRNSTFGFSRAKIAVTMGTKAEGDDQWRSIVNEWPIDGDALRRAAPASSGRAPPRPAPRAARRPARGRRGCARFFSPQFQILRPAICHSAARQCRPARRSSSLELAAHGEEVGVAARAGRAARRTRAGRGRCRSGTAPAGGRRRAPPRGRSGRGSRSRGRARGAAASARPRPGTP